MYLSYLITTVNPVIVKALRSRSSQVPQQWYRSLSLSIGPLWSALYNNFKKYEALLLNKSMKYHLIPSKHYRRASLFFSFTSKFVNQMVYWSLRTKKKIKHKGWMTFWVRALEQPQSIVEKYVQTEPQSKYPVLH